MTVTKKLICILAAGAALGVAAPAFADPGRDRGYDHNRDQRQYGNYDRHGYRDNDRGYNRRNFVVVQRPLVLERPVYYAQPSPIAYIGAAALIGAVIGGYIDHRR